MRLAFHNRIEGIKTYKVEHLFYQKLLAVQHRTEARDLFDLSLIAERFGSQLTHNQINTLRGFVADPDQLVEAYRLSFQADEVLPSITTIENTVLSLYCRTQDLQAQQSQTEFAQTLSDTIALAKTLQAKIQQQTLRMQNLSLAPDSVEISSPTPMEQAPPPKSEETEWEL